MVRVTQPTELNLRKFAVLGGVLHLDLLEQPPQPRELGRHLALTVCKYIYCSIYFQIKSNILVATSSFPF